MSFERFSGVVGYYLHDKETDLLVMTDLTYNRALHPDDYLHPDLAPHVATVRRYLSEFHAQGAPVRMDHEHRLWEYANVLRQLHELYPELGGFERKAIHVHDVGSGGSPLPLILAKEGYRVTISDSMAYGDFVDVFLIPQCLKLGLEIPVYRYGAEELAARLVNATGDAAIDVITCISVIEHLMPGDAANALHGFAQLVAPQQGYVFLTSDYFRDEAALDASPFKSIQHTAFTSHRMQSQVVEALLSGLHYVGDQDFTYRGDFVNNYSFLNMVLEPKK
jgi:hypothetical protein